MIDFGKELEEFDFFSVDNNMQNTHKELTNVFNEVNSILGRIGKEQGKANIQLEELMLILDEEKEKDEAIKKLKKSIDSSEYEKLSIVKGLIEVLDHVENLYRLFSTEENESLHQQLSLMWNLISKILLSIGITRIDDENTMFNPLLNSITGTSSDTGLDEGIILNVLKSGYIYKDMVLRKSEVIANKYIPIPTQDDNIIENEYEEMYSDNVENVEAEEMYGGGHKDGMDNAETEAVYDESNNDESNNDESNIDESNMDNSEDIEPEEDHTDKGGNMKREDEYVHKDGSMENVADYTEGVEAVEGTESAESSKGACDIESAESSKCAYSTENVESGYGAKNGESTYGTGGKESTEDIVIKEVTEGYKNIHTKRQMNVPVQMKHMNVQIEEYTDVKMKDCTRIQIQEHVDVQVEGDTVAQVKKHTNVCMKAMNKENIYIVNDETGVRTDETEINTDETETNSAKSNNLMEGEIDE